MKKSVKSKALAEIFFIRYPFEVWEPGQMTMQPQPSGNILLILADPEAAQTLLPLPGTQVGLIRVIMAYQSRGGTGALPKAWRSSRR